MASDAANALTVNRIKDGGQSIKAIGKAAREELKDMLGQDVHLILFVKVDPKWMDRREAYATVGLEFDA